MNIVVIILSVFVILWIVKTIIIWRIRKKRDNINFTTEEGVEKIRRLNKIINSLNGF